MMMKLFKQLTVLCFLAALVSCAREATVFERVKQDEVKLLSFGFYEADNPGMILKDYILSNPKEGVNTIRMPEAVDKSHLIARFTASNGNVVKVNNALQKSGETQNDFSIPVDYFLSAGNNNAKYSFAIAKDFSWETFPFTYNDSASGMNLKVNPVSGEPYIMYYEKRSSSSEQGAAMVAFRDGAWAYQGRISDGRTASNIDFTFDNAGVPYASYVDYTATVAQANTVKKYTSGTSWELVGRKGVTTAKVTFNALTFDADAKLFLFSYLDAADVLPRRALGVSVFDNNAWTTNGSITGRSSALYGYLPVAKRVNNAVYVGVLNASSPNSVSVYKYENNTWTTLVEQWRDPNATAINVRDFDMEVDQKGNVYIAFADNSSTALYKYRVIKYDVVTKAVTPVGGYIAGASGNLFGFDLAVSPSDELFLFYKNSSNYPTVTMLDKDTKDWSLPHIMETAVGDELNMSFAPNGDGYISYLKDFRIFIYKFTATP